MTDSLRPARDIQPAPSQMRDISQLGHPVVKTTLAVLSAVALTVSAVGYFTVGRVSNQLSASELRINAGRGQSDKDQIDGAMDILLVGSDSRTDAQGNPLSESELAHLNAGVADGEINTDTIMIIRVPDDGSRATAVSIPRDTYVHTDDYGNMKINGVYGAHAAAKREELIAAGKPEGPALEQEVARAGQLGLIDAINDLTGVEVDHYAQVGLLGFVLLTDAVGGVDVCLNAAVDEPLSGAHFPAGQQTLDGAQALSFVRQRHDLPRGDLDRIVRQQAYMASLVQKVLSAGTLTSPAKLRDLATAAERSVTLDQSLDVMRFAQQMSGLAGGNVTFTTIPVTSVNGVGDFGESIVTVDINEVHSFMESAAKEQVPGDSQPEQAPQQAEDFAGAQVSVLNAGSVPGQARATGEWLADAGITVSDVSNAMDGIYWESQVVAADPEDPRARKLAEMLGGVPVTANNALEPGSIIAVVAEDYNGPAKVDPEDAQQHVPVGTPGDDISGMSLGPEIDAGGQGPRCVN
ncbi:LCP family protein [uncultured Corynebacterium sp.]|uniref:LCP family protein n=1 Tax=uncultured Corynebacterium sp. TaxID=159447 RepID=UPI00259B0D74|nr:LCP family protein [uncultured Corynebacterium sp.]